jgi:hypothetical protein
MVPEMVEIGETEGVRSHPTDFGSAELFTGSSGVANIERMSMASFRLWCVDQKLLQGRVKSEI